MLVLWTTVPPNAKKPAMGLKGVVNGNTIGKNACGPLTFRDHWLLLTVIGVRLCVQVREVKLFLKTAPIIKVLTAWIQKKNSYFCTKTNRLDPATKMKEMTSMTDMGSFLTDGEGLFMIVRLRSHSTKGRLEQMIHILYAMKGM